MLSLTFLEVCFEIQLISMINKKCKDMNREKV